MEEIGFEKVHVFPYSVRKGTRAEKLDGHLDKKVKEERCRIMIEKAEKIRRDFFAEQVGKTFNIIIESKTDDGYYTGHTANYIPVKTKLPSDLNGSIVDVKIVGVSDGDYLTGEII
jgi:threonylcarbamoyladenosine tRNA methylthiotransferase MtaB